MKDWTGITVNGEEIVSTPGHKYYLPFNKRKREVGEVHEQAGYAELSEKWVSACDLKAGDRVLLADVNPLTGKPKYGIIQKVRSITYDEPQTTHNFEVQDYHTYYVGEQSVCVHNKAPCGKNPNGIYKDADYHYSKQSGGKSPKPLNGQAALDNSVQIKPTSPRRLGYSENQFVILDQTSPGLYHGHVPKLPHQEQIINNIIRNWRR